ncbi:hypothetical protein ACU635_08595 [[Actinomadura] parvosata]|uniref:hypothetical protein n=1 Tax=[Actinomadura] parvosata TaxID=1955412 RepID=UPI00406D02ED
MRIVSVACVLVLAGCTGAPAGTVPKSPSPSASPTESGAGDEETSAASDDSADTVLDVAVAGPDAAWAVGDTSDLDEDSRDVRLPFALRWDGRRWRTFRPARLPKVGALADVAVDGSRAFLVGRRGEGKTSVPALVTWDGRRFGKRELPRGGTFHAVDAGAGHVSIGGSSSSGRCADARPAIRHSATRGSVPVESMDIYLCGGGKLAASLLPEIDEIILKSYPVVAGAGIPMFAGHFRPPLFTPTRRESFDNGAQVTWLTRA